MNENPNLTPPTITVADYAHATARATLAAIPYGGGAALEVFNALITPPIERRRQKWMGDVGSGIERLRAANANIVETLKNSEPFQSVLLHATWAAVRNHQHEKLVALKNAVLNAAQGAKVSEDIQLLFVRYVDELTPTHLAVMDFFVKHEKDLVRIESYQRLIDAFSQKSNQPVDANFFKLVCDDLQARSLLRISNDLEDLPGLYAVTSLGIEKKSQNPTIIVTELGRAFVRFVIESPGKVTQ